MSRLLRALLYPVCLFLIAVVYTGQKHSTASATVAAAGRTTVRMLVWTVVGAFIMLVTEFLFID